MMKDHEAKACADALKAVAQALTAVGALRDICGSSREIAIAITNLETGALWVGAVVEHIEDRAKVTP